MSPFDEFRSGFGPVFFNLAGCDPAEPHIGGEHGRAPILLCYCNDSSPLSTAVGAKTFTALGTQPRSLRFHISIQVDQHVTNDARWTKIEPHFAIFLECPGNKTRTETPVISDPAAAGLCNPRPMMPLVEPVTSDTLPASTCRLLRSSGLAAMFTTCAPVTKACRGGRLSICPRQARQGKCLLAKDLIQSQL